MAKSEHKEHKGQSANGRARGALGRARTAVAVAAARTTGAGLRRLRLGGGTSLPGLVAGGLDPRIVANLSAQLRHGSVVVTGTNGKTTTSGLLAYMLTDAGLRVWRNREGANLLRGVTAALVIRSELNGMLRAGGDAAAVFEVDEAAFPRVIAELGPRVIAVTNLFRDQLDRYGEVDTVAERWRNALAKTPDTTALALNADDPAIAALAGASSRPVVYFGVEDVAAQGRGDDGSGDVIDTRTCPRCRAPLDYTVRFYSHIGHWSCPGCGYARPTPAIRARAVSPDGLDATRFRLETDAGAAQVTLGLPGLYNVYNALAAAAAAQLMGAGLDATRTAIERFTPAFGRAERIAADGRFVRILLAKNPTGLNEVLRALALPEGDRTAPRRHLFLLLNDRAADGEDVSWIWDADFERVPSIARDIVVGGTRAADLAVRLKYAGVGAGADIPITVEPDVARGLDAALALVPEGETLYVVPTYTAMLAVRGELERRGYAPHYWEAADA